MASFGTTRPTVYNGLYVSPFGNLNIKMPIAGAKTFYNGEFVRTASNLLEPMATANTVADNADALGIFESPDMASAAASTLVDVTLFIPYVYYEMNLSGTAAAADIGTSYQIGPVTVDSRAVGRALRTATGNPAVRIAQCPWYFNFIVNSYIDRAATSVTAGQTMASNPEKGVIGDTNARFLVVAIAGATEWGS